MHRYAAFFDLDYTIFRMNSGRLMAQYAARNGLLKNGHLLYAYLYSFAYKFGILSEEYIMYRLGTFLRGIKEENLIQYTKTIFDTYLNDSIRPEVCEEIAEHKQNGGKCIILSASTPYMCGLVKDRISMDDMVCSELEVIDGALSGYPVSAYCYGKEKANRLQKYCAENNFLTSEAWYYGDALSDKPAFESVGNPVCVVMDKKLEKVAEKNGWKIVKWK